MTSGPITSWQIEGETVKAVTDYIFLGSKIIADGDCSHEVKTLAPWEKSYEKPGQPIKKQRHHFSNTIVQKYQFFNTQFSLWSNFHIQYMTSIKTIALTRWTFVDKELSLLFNKLSRLVITFLARNKHLLISWL